MSKDLFWGLLLFLTLSQWIVYAKVREWWRSRHPEPKQGKPVDRVLWHMISDTETPWDAGTSWEKHGRGYIVALQRQGLDELLDERDVSDHKAAYTLGYCVREQEDTKELEALKKRLERREAALQRKQVEVEELRGKLAQRPAAAPTPQRNTKPVDPLQESWHEWGTCVDSLETIMQRKGWVRATETMTAVEDSTQTKEPDYKTLKGKDKINAMLQLKAEGKTNAEIAQLFGMTVGGVKGIISKNKPRPDNLVTLDFGVSERVSDGF